MHLTRVPMNTANLSVGMYVGQLDRPWLETPFVFQGFEIKDKFEIEQLQSYCNQVYVEIERGKLTESQIRALAMKERPTILAPHEETPGKVSFIHRFIFRMGLGNLFGSRKRGRTEAYEITSTVRREAPKAKQAFEQCGQAYRKIFERTRRVGNVNVRAAVRAVTPIIQSVLRNPDAMAWTVFAGKRSGRRYSRAAARAVFAVMFGRHLGMDRKALEDLAVGALLLDIGNVTLPDDLLHEEGAITHDQFEPMAQHVQAGVDILMRSRDIEPPIFEMVMYHHDRFDGSGYPHEISGSNIPPFGRIAGIVDCYDAMTTKTSYSPALAAYDAARELNEMRDKQFSAEVVEQFLHTIGMFPTGSVIELSNGAVGLVLEQNRENPLQPKVLVLRSADGETLKKPKIINGKQWQGRGLWIARGHEHGAFGIDPADYFN